MSRTTTESVDKVVKLLKVIKYCCQYDSLEKSTPKEVLDEAWGRLDVDRQQIIITMIEQNIQPTPKSIAEEILLCESKEELNLLKAEFGAELSQQAWILLSDEQKAQIHQMCATPASPPEVKETAKLESKTESEPESESDLESEEDDEKIVPKILTALEAEPAQRQVTLELHLDSGTNEPAQPTKSKSLIQLSEEEQELQNIISGILEDTEGRIPPDLADAFDELLSRQAENDKQLKVKIDNYCAVMKHHYDWAEIRSKESERLKELAERDLAVAKVLEARLKNYLETSGSMKIKTKRFNPRICKNGGKTPIKLNVPVEDLPPKYKVRKELINADFETLREVLEAGEELSFASLGERGTHLRYK